MDTVSVVIPTFGDRRIWNPLAMRAARSVINQTHSPDEVIRIHGKDLRDARNHGGIMATSDWILFVDADDEISPDYLEAMLNGSGDLRYPMVYIQDRGVIDLYEGQPLIRGNYLPIGTLVRREMFMNTGGFPEYPALEDWAFWLRCEALGSKTKLVPGATYYAHRNPNGRNSHIPHGLPEKILNDFEIWKEQNAPEI
jgi:glycosyltransferase involved in cell wall biosynthesis